MGLDHFDRWVTQPFAVIDTETTGLDPSTAGVVELAVVRFEPGTDEPQTFSTFVDPGHPIPEAATKIHGIRDEDVKGAPFLVDALDAAATLLRGAIPVAYNAPFDHRFVHAELDKIKPYDRWREVIEAYYWPTWLDPLVMIRVFDRWVKGSGRHKLSTTCQRWNVRHDSAHRALGDATATGRLLRAIVKQQPRIGDLAIGELIRRQRVQALEQEADHAAFRSRQPAREQKEPAS